MASNVITKEQETTVRRPRPLLQLIKPHLHPDPISSSLRRTDTLLSGPFMYYVTPPRACVRFVFFKQTKTFRLHSSVRWSSYFEAKVLYFLHGTYSTSECRNGRTRGKAIIHFPQRASRPLGSLSFFSTGGSKDQKRKMALC